MFQLHIDPFEEIEFSGKNAEQHRRNASEKEVRIDVLLCWDLYYSVFLRFLCYFVAFKVIDRAGLVV